MGYLPSKIDLDDLLSEVKGNRTKIQNLRENIIYFLSLLSPKNNLNSEDGYRTLYSVYLQHVMGHSYKLSIKLLIEKGIIEKKNYRTGKYSSGYRLTNEYFNDDFIEYELGDKIQTNLSKIGGDLMELVDQGEFNYNFIYEQFTQHQLTIDNEVYDFIRTIFEEIFEKIDRKKIFKKETILKTLDQLGRYLVNVENIENMNFKPKVSTSNGRLSSILTETPKILRPYLQINGITIGEVDVSSSQPFVLSTILNPTFTESEEEGYNLLNIYPELYHTLKTLKKIHPSNNGRRNKYVMGVHFYESDFDLLKDFTEFGFSEHDFYNYILSKVDNPEVDRDKVKSNIMNFLFEKNTEFRNDNKIINMISEVFPSLSYFTEYFVSVYGGTEFSYLLQKTESYLILKKVCKKLNENFPEIPFYTIHDSILTTIDNIEIVNNLMTQTIETITGKKPGIKSKVLEKPEDMDKDLNSIWEKVLIKSQSSFEKQQWSMIKSNMEKGSQFLFNRTLDETLDHFEVLE